MSGEVLRLRSDARALPLADGSVHTVVTSPPYFGLRDYGVPGQIGLEPSPDAYVAAMVEVFREVRRVLRDDGVAWLNLGDSYAGNGGAVGGGATRLEVADAAKWRKWNKDYGGLESGNLLGVPWRVASALQADGWILRSDIVWAKKAPMPESVSGWRWQRCRVKVRGGQRAERPALTVARENSAQSDHDGHDFAPSAEWTDCQGCRKCEANMIPCSACDGTGVERGALHHSLGIDAIPMSDDEHRAFCAANPCPDCSGRGKIGLRLRRGSWRPTRAHEVILMLAKSDSYFCDGEAVREPFADERMGRDGATASSVRNVGGRQDGFTKPNGIDPSGNGGRNPRSVWHLGPEPFAGAHFAVMPSEIPRRCILAGTSSRVCSTCGAPYAPVVERSAMVIEHSARGAASRNGANGIATGRVVTSGTMIEPARSRVLGHRPTCACSAPSASAVVLDPFAGAGTTGCVASELGRRAILCDLSIAYLRDVVPLRTRHIAKVFAKRRAIEDKESLMPITRAACLRRDHAACQGDCDCACHSTEKPFPRVLVTCSKPDVDRLGPVVDLVRARVGETHRVVSAADVPWDAVRAETGWRNLPAWCLSEFTALVVLEGVNGFVGRATAEIAEAFLAAGRSVGVARGGRVERVARVERSSAEGKGAMERWARLVTKSAGIAAETEVAT